MFYVHAIAHSGSLHGLQDYYEQVGAENFANTINSRDHRGFTVLHKAVESNNLDVIKYLLDKGAEINAEVTGEDPCGWTALHLAAFDDFTQVILLLISRGAKIHYKDRSPRRMTPIRVAVTRGNENSLEVLLNAGADAKEVNPMGFTLLHEAANHGSIKMATLLLNAGADPKSRAKDFSLPYDWAQPYNDARLLKLLDPNR
jgi:ankyrin repeat protein